MSHDSPITDGAASAAGAPAPTTEPAPAPGGAPAAAVAGRRVPFIGFLFRGGTGFWRYVVQAALVSSVGAFVLVTLGVEIVLLAGGDPSYGSALKARTWGDAFALVVIAPLIETLLLAGLLAILRFIPSLGLRTVVSAVLWGTVHVLSRGNPVAMATAWGFFVMSWTWITWRSVSLKRAYAATALVHALYNGATLAVGGMS